MILTSGKEHYLGFLRNLTPQILLLSIAIVMATELDINRWEPSNWRASLPYLFVITTFVLAAVANIFDFIEKTCTSFASIDTELQAMKKCDATWSKRFKTMLSLLWTKSKFAFIEALIAVAIVQVGFGVVIVGSIPAAATLYTTIHGNQTECK